ncbi:hypothetical protein [Sedimentibacter sp.]|uniref:hypothetical protein n=1 Tax=Sedimentibacter sp. TaxID=1960295 RepID=UPI0028AB862A|nr:hypothetical protein [Sedimentibacter sp.]
MKIINLLTIILILTLSTACANNVSDNNSDSYVKENESIEEEPKDVQIDRNGILSGEIITDGIYGNSGAYFLYFIPDKETREFLYNYYPFEIGDNSIPLEFNNLDSVKDLPEELGIYKVEIEADFTANTEAAYLRNVKLTDTIGTVEYEGKVYATNDLDENVQPKDKVCGLIVENVRRYNDGGVIISFEGEIESEGFYNVYPGGDVFQYRKIGKIIVDNEYKNNFPTYKGTSNIFSVWFTETNKLYDELANFSAIGRGKFKTSNYYIIYNYGIGPGPGEILT